MHDETMQHTLNQIYLDAFPTITSRVFLCVSAAAGELCTEAPASVRAKAKSGNEAEYLLGLHTLAGTRPSSTRWVLSMGTQW